MGPSGPHVVGDANERLDRDQCRGAEQKQEALDCGHVRESRADATSNQVLSSEEKATEGADVMDVDKANAHAGGCSVPVPRAFQDTESPSSEKSLITEDFETSTGLEIVRANLLSCMLKDPELSLSDVLQAKAFS
eukprot:symbB.v1.2.036866.t1/scaffold5308.1/size28557/1